MLPVGSVASLPGLEKGFLSSQADTAPLSVRLVEQNAAGHQPPAPQEGSPWAGHTLTIVLAILGPNI